jgi:hypothetical protein
MKANKVTVKIKIESLSIDVLSGLLMKVITEVENERENGELIADDGDSVKWETKRKKVKF